MKAVGKDFEFGEDLTAPRLQYSIHTPVTSDRCRSALYSIKGTSPNALSMQSPETYSGFVSLVGSDMSAQLSKNAWMTILTSRFCLDGLRFRDSVECTDRAPV